jgi:iron complex outermembrane receptor protein
MKPNLMAGASVLASLVLAAAWATPGVAATDTTTPGTDDSTQLQTLTVTAEKRAENIQDVPLAVTAVSGDELRDQHIEQLQELRFTDTSVQYRVSTGSNTSAFAVRGVGTASFSSGIEQSVSTVVDGIVLGDPSSVATLADVDHVEILRGPQGMLFGKNASAGVISIATTDPKIGKWEGAAHLSYGENNEQIFQGILNVPLNDQLAGRVVVTHNALDGWATDPLFGNRGINPIDIDAVRAKLLWTPTDHVRTIFSVDYSSTDKFCCSQVVRASPDPHTGVAVGDAASGIVAGPDNYQVADGAPPTGYGHIGGASAQMDIDFAKGYLLTGILGYRRSIRANFYDADFEPFNFADVNGGTSDLKNSSAELRITSPSNQRFDFVAGLFGYSSHTQGTIGQIGYFANPTIDTDVIPAASQILASDAQSSNVHSWDYAVYGQGRYHITDTLSLIAGARYTHDKLTLNYSESGLDHTLPLRGFYPASGFPANSYIGYAGPYVTPCVTAATAPAQPNCFPAFGQETSASNTSWRVGLEDQFTPDVMAYATASRGYKGPGFSSLTITASNIVNGLDAHGNVIPGGTADQTIKPEIPTSYEIGLKTAWFDHRVIFNIDAFDTTYKDFQAQVTTPTPNGFVSVVKNAGDVKTQGVEASFAAKLTPDLTANLNASFIHARYGDFAGVSCYTVLTNPATGATAFQPGCNTAAGNTINAAGHPLAGSPDEQYTAALNYQHPNALGNKTVYAQANYYWQSAVQYQASGDPSTIQKAFGMLGGSLGFGPASDKWRLSVYATNVLNQHWVAGISAAPTAALNPGGYIQYFAPDSFRHIGVRLDARF